ncbi:MAG: hypothetical protein U9N33_00715 [Campylobacterota bacterium]|nr:hypothetical protein [Campylobacterota bacterium]
MNRYVSDGKKLIDVEYDDIPVVNDMVDGMRVLSTDKRAEDENALFLLKLDGTICCYVLDEIYIVGKADNFESLVEAIEAWRDEEI